MFILVARWYPFALCFGFKVPLYSSQPQTGHPYDNMVSGLPSYLESKQEGTEQSGFWVGLRLFRGPSDLFDVFSHARFAAGPRVACLCSFP